MLCHSAPPTVSAQVHNLREALECEQATKKKLQRRADRQIESLVAEVEGLRQEQLSKASELLQLQEQLSEQRTKHLADVALLEQQVKLVTANPQTTAVLHMFFTSKRNNHEIGTEEKMQEIC